MELNLNNFKKEFDKKIIRKFSDMEASYKNVKNIKKNPLIYTVYIRDYGLFEAGLTIIEPGTINSEFFMTKGHRHKIPRKEIYIHQKGKGKLILEGRKGKIVSIEKNKIYEIPSTYGHRLVNKGNKKLEVLTIYSKDSGHDYNFKFKKRIFKNKK